MKLYDGVLSNLIGKDRRDALAVIDDDEKFDAWLKAYNEKSETESTTPTSSGGGGKRRVSQQEYLDKYAVYH